MMRMVLATAVLSAQLSAAARQVVTHGMDIDPSFSPDGKRMVVVTIADRKEQLSILNADGSGRQMLLADANDHEDPAWSPDGRLIAYVLKTAKSEVIHVIRPDGTGDQAVSPAEHKAIHPAWTRDGSQILYCTDDDLKPPAKNDSEIYSVDLATGASRVVIRDGVNTYPAPSPDGRRIAFRRMLPENNSEVFLANADGTEARNLTNDPSFDGWPDWSPDGTRIAFASNREGNHKVYVMKADGSDVRLVADTPGRGTAPRWTPDGREIYWTVCEKSGCAIWASAPPKG